VAVDHFSGYTWATLLPTQGAEQLADYLYAVFSVEGVPTTYQCDNARNFDADCIHQAIDEAIKATSGMNNGDGPGPRNIVHGLPYNPRAQGKVERKNSVLKNKFYKRIKDIWSKGSGTQIDIVREMAGVVARENSAINTRNGYTPYQILRGLDVDNRPILDRTAMWAEVAIAQRKQGEADLKRLTEKSDKRRKRIQLEVGDPVRARNYTPAKTPGRAKLWTARGTIVAERPRTERGKSGVRQFKVKWRTKGLGDERAGTTSKRWYKQDTHLTLDNSNEEVANLDTSQSVGARSTTDITGRTVWIPKVGKWFSPDGTPVSQRDAAIMFPPVRGDRHADHVSGLVLEPGTSQARNRSSVLTSFGVFVFGTASLIACLVEPPVKNGTAQPPKKRKGGDMGAPKNTKAKHKRKTPLPTPSVSTVAGPGVIDAILFNAGPRPAATNEQEFNMARVEEVLNSP
jgi:hypothetical protein